MKSKLGILLVGLTLLTPTNSFSQPAQEKWFKGLQVSYISLSVLDAYGTVRCVEQRSCHEANPILRPLVDRHGIRAAMTGKLLTQGGIDVGLIYLWKKHPNRKKEILLSLATLTALQGYVDYRNYQTLRRH